MKASDGVGISTIRDLLSIAVESELGALWLWPSSARETWMRNAREALSFSATRDVELRGVADTLIVAANNPVASGGLEGLRHIMKAQAMRLRRLTPPQYPHSASEVDHG